MATLVLERSFELSPQLFVVGQVKLVLGNEELVVDAGEGVFDQGMILGGVACPPKPGPVLMGIVQLAQSQGATHAKMRKRPGPNRIASILCDVQADLAAGLNVNQACRKAGIASTTYYRWKSLQENPISNEQFRILELEAEVDRRMLQEALKKSHDRPPTSLDRHQYT